MRKIAVSSIFGILGGLVLLFALGRAILHHPEKKLPFLGQAGAFELTEKSGKKVTLGDLNGKIWIGDFIFTRCMGICPIMSNHMKRIQEELKDQSGVRFVSFSVDPEHDTPEKLTEYAKRFNADPEKWLFLTGDKKTIFDLSLQHFHLGVGEVPEEERPSPDQFVSHSSRFVLVDRQGGIRGYYDSAETGSVDQLIRDARKLAKES